jgi:hypothetical protein
MPRHAGQRHQPIAIRDAEPDALNLGAVDSKKQIVAQPFDAGDLETHPLQLRPSTPNLQLSTPKAIGFE